MKKLIAAAALIVTSTGVGLAQDVEKGANVFKQCQVCHSIGPGAKNKIGPELNGLDGRKAGVVPNFNYSDANKNSGVVWNEENFKEYAKYPRAFVPGTKMIFPGLKDQQQVNCQSGLMHRSKQHLYSITSSAIESTPGGTSMPSARAV